ncbi:MAG TPA: hypothetical protein DEP72_04665 [Clostridiales bacterium]|nr:MAG: hypothetical protein A2Y18_05460 [Clostridiales bacterium GWD2_32_19]HCC07435.1 hypothetical protein [Clostridiales bacterium]
MSKQLVENKRFTEIYDLYYTFKKVYGKELDRLFGIIKVQEETQKTIDKIELKEYGTNILGRGIAKVRMIYKNYIMCELREEYKKERDLIVNSYVSDSKLDIVQENVARVLITEQIGFHVVMSELMSPPIDTLKKSNQITSENILFETEEKVKLIEYMNPESEFDVEVDSSQEGINEEMTR